MALYANVGGSKKRLKELYGNVNGSKKKIKSMWVNKNGVAVKIYSIAASVEYGYRKTRRVEWLKNNGLYTPVIVFSSKSLAVSRTRSIAFVSFMEK